jgi:hypothetical protein
VRSIKSSRCLLSRSSLYNSPSGQRVIIKEFDRGESTEAECLAITRTDLPLTLTCSTQIGPFSVHLSVFTPPDIASRTDTLPTSIITSNSQLPGQPLVTSTTSMLASPASATSSLALATPASATSSLASAAPSPVSATSSLASAAPSPASAASSLASAAPSPVSATSSLVLATPSPASATPSHKDDLGTGAEVGSILGAIFGAIAIAVAIFYGQKQLKKLHQPRLQIARATLP